MYRLLSRAEVLALLSPYGASFVKELFTGAELWRTRSGLELVLTPEYDGTYHEYMVLQAIELSIRPRMG